MKELQQKLRTLIIEDVFKELARETKTGNLEDDVIINKILNDSSSALGHKVWAMLDEIKEELKGCFYY